ncbi:MAG: hypothetical protein QXU18_16420, partial [Thermoplasmatales archaeon]
GSGMIALFAETPKDREIIDYPVDQTRKLKEEIEHLNKENEEYKKRHPSTVCIKNGKAYVITEEHTPRNANIKNPRAQPGQKGYFRKIQRITLRSSGFSYPVFSSTLVREDIRKRVIDDIHPIEPSIIQYRIERMYCRNCRETLKSQVPTALPCARLFLRTMPITAYLKTGMRMSIESVSTTMKEMLCITISEVEVQDILYQLSNALGDE